MMFTLRSLYASGWGSKPRVYDEEKRVEEFGRGVEEDDEGPCTSLTVWRKSLLPSCCSGFTVIDSKGSLVYRVDNYIGRPGEVVLMDGNGRSILTNRRRKGLRLVDDWLMYQGEASEDNIGSLLKRSTENQTLKKKIHHQPVYSVKKHINILQPNSSKSNVLVHVYPLRSEASDHHRRRQNSGKRSPLYIVEGSYCQRSCKVVECFDGFSSSKPRRRKVIAEIKRKETINGCASFGSEVFQLIVWPGFDPATAMALILLLDQMFT